MKFKIPIHSVIDIITNSSTEIFTYSHGCIEPLKELIEEMFKIHGIDHTFDEVFTAVIACENEDVYTEYEVDIEKSGFSRGSNIAKSLDIGENRSTLTDEEKLQVVEDVKAGKYPKPDWMSNAEDEGENYDGYEAQTNLYITAKKDKYNKFAELVKTFLYSTSHEASNG